MMNTQMNAKMNTQTGAKNDFLYNKFRELDIEYKTLDHKVIKTMEEGKNIMAQLEGNVCLNLFLKDEKGKFYLVVKMLGGRLDLVKMAKQLGIEKLKMASPKEMMSLLQVPKGCCSVFAICNDKSKMVTILIDKCLPKDEKVNFHPLRNNATTTISYADMLKYITHFGNNVIYAVM